MQLRAEAARPGPAEAGTHPSRTLGARARPGGAGDSSPQSAVRAAPSANHGLAAACGDCPGRARLPAGSPPPLGRAGPGGRRRAAAAEGPGYLGGCWWLGSFPDGRGTSGRGSGARTRREGGRDPSAETPAGRRAGLRLQTLGLQSRRWRQLTLRLPQDLPRAGPRWRRSLHRVSCHPRNGPDHKRRGEDARAASGARKRVAETDPTATPLPQSAPLESTRPGRGPPHWPSRLKRAGIVACASAVACPRLPGKLLRRFARCVLRGPWVQKYRVWRPVFNTRICFSLGRFCILASATLTYLLHLFIIYQSLRDYREQGRPTPREASCAVRGQEAALIDQPTCLN